jgi:hypothetical protein
MTLDSAKYLSKISVVMNPKWSRYLGLSHISDVVVVNPMLSAQLIVFVAKHAATVRAVTDAVAHEILGNAQQWIVAANTKRNHRH